MMTHEYETDEGNAIVGVFFGLLITGGAVGFVALLILLFNHLF
jgi:hypothetical protein